jgi:hypothetical protein
MAQCGGCGAESPRCRVIFDGRNRKVAEECQVCRPENFHDAFAVPSDRHPWEGYQVYPHLYKMGADGILHAKDELIQDTWDQWKVNGAEELRQEERKKRRGKPMTEDEIAAAKVWGEQCLRPAIDQSQSSGLIL